MEPARTDHDTVRHLAGLRDEVLPVGHQFTGLAAFACDLILARRPADRCLATELRLFDL